MRKKSFFILFVLFVVLYQSHAADIQYDKDYKKFPIFNKKNGKVIHYFILHSNEKLKLRTIDVDTLQIYSRVLTGKKVSYSYKIKNKKKRTVTKKGKLSKVSQGLGGESVSSYNKLLFPINRSKEKIEITNLSKNDLLFKIASNNIHNNNHKVKYIKYSPEIYEDDLTLLINDKSYTYFNPEKKDIEFTLEGPVVLKIISRILFGKEEKIKASYNYRIFDNEEISGEINCSASPSKKAVLLNNTKEIPSSGDTHIVMLAKGKHRIRIEGDNENKVIFRFYISRSSVEIMEK